MSGHLSVDRLEGYRARTLGADELLAVDDHLATCESCRAHLSAASLGESRLHAARQTLDFSSVEPRHLDYDEIARFVDDRHDAVDREIVESHIAVCRQCAVEVEDLRALRRDLAANDGNRAVSAQPLTASQTTSGWRSFAAWKIPLQIAAAAALVAAISLALIQPMRNSIDRLAARVGELERENVILKEQIARASGRQPATATESRPALVDAGGRIVINPTGEIVGLAAAEQQLVQRAVTAGRLDTPQWLEDLRGESGTLMGESTTGMPFRLIEPLGSGVESTRPTLRWAALADSDHYRVVVLDSRLDHAVTSPALRATEWTIPQPLKRDEIYSWQVIATRGDKDIVSPAPPAPEARFRVIGEREAAELQRLRRAYSGSHLVLGLAYAKAGLVHRAASEFEQLVKLNPASDVARRLLEATR